MLPQDLDQLYKAMLAGSLIGMLLSLIFVSAFMAMWIYPLIHCLKNRHDGDRMVWVLVTLIGGPIGGIIYLCVGRLPKPPNSVTGEPSVPLVTQRVSQKIAKESIDHVAMHDDKQRAQAINEAIWNETKARRASNR